MAVVLTTISLLAAIAGGVAMTLGFTIRSADALSLHTAVGWTAILASLFSHAMTIFYLFGVGKALAGEKVAEGYLEEARRLRARLAPILAVAAVGTVILAVAGGAAYGGKVSIDAHRRIALVMVAGNTLAALWTGIVLAANQAMLLDVEAARAGEPASGPRL